MKDDQVYLRHIQDCISRIEEDTADGKEAFIASHTYQDAVLRNFQTLSESTKRLSDHVKSFESEIDWRRIAAFRNILVHDYLGIDIETVWKIVENDIPRLKQAISNMLSRII